MKKEYIAPQMEVYRLQVQGQLLLIYSGAGLGAHEFVLEDEDDMSFNK